MKTPKEQKQETVSSPRTPMDLWRMMGGKAERVRSASGKPTDSMLAVYRDRLTYTFIMGDEVASIHFDRGKGEIFFKGHNIKNEEIDAAKIAALESLKGVLSTEERGKDFLKDYEATLAKCCADKK